MKRLISMAMAAFCAAAMFHVGSARAQMDPQYFNFNIDVNQIIGQTCLSNPTKCATLIPPSEQELELGSGGPLVPVVDLDIITHGDEDLMILFCPKVEDQNFNELECQATISVVGSDDDGVVADPGSLKPLEQTFSDPMNPTGVTIYQTCLSWLGTAMGTGKSDTTNVLIECLQKMDNAEGAAVEISSYTATVFAK